MQSLMSQIRPARSGRSARGWGALAGWPAGRLSALLLALAAAASAPAAASALPLAQAAAQADGTGEETSRSGPAFALPVTAAAAVSGAFPPPPGTPTELRAVSAAAGVFPGASGLPVLRVDAEANLRTAEANSATAAGSARFEDLLTVEAGAGVAEGLLTFGFVLSATPHVGPVAMPGQSALSRFTFGLAAGSAGAEIELLSAIGNSFGIPAGPDGQSRRRFVGVLTGSQSMPADIDETQSGANLFALDALPFRVVVPFVTGQPFDLRVAASCGVDVLALVISGDRPSAAAEATCRSGNSLAFGGVVGVTDTFGRPLPGARIVAASGIAYDARGVPPGAVPEPATWAMLVAGFGLVGSALRRRSAAPA